MLDDEREARERERSHVISSLCACFLASSSASSSSLWSPKTERKGIIEEGVVLPAAAEAGAESRWMEGRKEGRKEQQLRRTASFAAIGGGFSLFLGVFFFLYFFHHMISVISFVAKFSSFCEKYSEKRYSFTNFPFFEK